MYFDHVRCPSCKAAFDPEKVSAQGQMMACPYCHSKLSLKSLFGLADAFAEEETADLSLDDLVSSPVSGQQEEPNSDALKALKDLKKS